MSTQEVLISQQTNALVIANQLTAQTLDPTKEVFLYCDYVGDLSPSIFVSGTQSTNNVNGSFVQATGISSEGVFGVITMTVNPSASGSKLQGGRVGVYYSAKSSDWALDRNFKSSVAWEFVARVSFANGVDTYKSAIGVCETHGQPSATNHITNGACFRSEGAAGNMFACIAVAGVESLIDTGIGGAGWHTYRITCDAAVSVVRFYID